MFHGGAVTSAVVALVTSAAGVVVAEAGRLFAAGTDVAPWAQVGGTATAVGALAYVAKMLADGKLVAQPVADLMRSSDRREQHLTELIQQGHDREDALRSFLVGRAAKP